jgi:hypothetical protein
MKAVGRCLTVGELIEAIAGLDELTPVAAHDCGLSEVVAGVDLVEIDPGVSIDIDAWRWQSLLYDLIDAIASAGTISDARDAADNAAEEVGYIPGGRRQ